jgi:gluconate 2-dehydrogenase gamma chain
MTFISRRDLLKRAAAVGAVSVAPDAVGRPFQGRRSDGGDGTGDAESVALHQAPAREPLENLTATEADLLDAIVARLIPTDANGPGATEARAAHYIDRALGGALASSRPAYTAGLAALDRYARSSRGKAFTELAPTDQDSVLIDVETGAATGFTGSSAAFFGMVLNHTHQGTFGDPYYGGNANFVGWDLIGYPGVRTMVSAAEQQQLEKHQMKPNRKSAYDYQTFTKATARAGEQGLPRRSSSAPGAKAGA